ncbi:hypothetical protein OESDEN_13653 [Oesophagostomum dentatum]|uniref:Uncharacterized protein n=1 Tax=Oesophagostomum dentatum TaxID=61180 RepID=A0A0B1STS4_OESDE|nr:hypothetical protein OESDEN_13653 [Oesophagostomum dentatum]
MDSLDHVLMQEEDRVVIEEVMTDNNYHEESIPREVAAPPNFLEIETEEPEPNDDVAIVAPPRHEERREPSPSASASPEIPAPSKQKRGRKPKSSEPRRRVNKTSKTADSDEGAPGGSVLEEVQNKPVRRSNRAAAITARKRLVTHDDDLSDEE